MRYLSLCSGIEAASVAWEPLGWTPVAFAEIDPYRCDLLRHYWPDVPNLGDLSTITEACIAALGDIDVVIGGTPCQDLSIAGLRAGIDGGRSRLFFDFTRIFDAARTFCGARWAAWENTPGAFSTNRGRDFARVVATLAGLGELRAPADGWGNEGVAVGPNGLVEWSVLDAQWFGLAQRRERVFVVLDTGNWTDRPPVLLEPEGLRGDSAPSREAGARVTGTLRPSAFDGSSACGGDGRDGLLVDEIAGPLLSNSHGAGWRTGAEEAAGNHYIVDEVAEPLTRANARNATHAGNNARARNVVVHAPTIAPALTAREHKGPDSSVTNGTIVAVAVADTLTAGGHPGSNIPGRHQEDDFNLVACFDETQVTHPENRSACGPELAALAASAKPPAIAFKPSYYTRGKDGAPSTICPPLMNDADKGDQVPIAFDGVDVRRLTPVECERLQGFPDGYTAIPRANGRPASDTQRYAALGDSIAVPALRWIGRQLEAAAACSGR